MIVCARYKISNCASNKTSAFWLQLCAVFNPSSLFANDYQDFKRESELLRTKLRQRRPAVLFGVVEHGV